MRVIYILLIIHINYIVLEYNTIKGNVLNSLHFFLNTILQ